MVEYVGSKERARIDALVAARQRAKGGKKDVWGLPPVATGWLRGRAVNVAVREEAGEFGVLVVLEFELQADPKQPGVPVRMSGTDIDRRVPEGSVMDVRDRTPRVRPITPHEIYFSHDTGHELAVTAHYPGRRTMTPRQNLVLGLLTLGGPIAFVLAAVAALHFVFHII